MLYDILKTIHVLAILVWVGGMVFTHFFLRPAVADMPPEQRLPLMHRVLGRFFKAVLAAVVLVLATGLWMIGRVAKETVQAGASFSMPLDWTVMSAVGILMMALFGHIRFALYPRLGRALAAGDLTAGASALAGVRRWVGVNLSLGLAIVVFTLVY